MASRAEEDKAKNEKRLKDEQIVINAFHRVFKSDDGKMVLAFLDGQFGMKSPAFIPKPDGSYDPYHAAIRDGQRSVKVQIEHILTMPCQGDANIQAKPKVLR